MDAYRKEIEDIDHQILDLLEKRKKIVEKIGHYKKRRGLPLRDMAREGMMLAKYAGKAVDIGLSAVAVSQIFKTVMSESRRIQKEIIGKPATVKKVRRKK